MAMTNVEGDFCTDCKKVTQVVFDHATGDSICLECGLVLESRIADQTAEWRTFANDDGDDRDPVRVGAPSNPLLDQERTVLETTIVNVNKRNGHIPMSALPAAEKSRMSFVHAFTRIDELCERLALNKTVKDLACDIYSKVHTFITRRDNSLVAGCVYIACPKRNQSRTLKEIGMAAGLAEKKIVIAKKFIMKVLEEKFVTSELSSMELGSGTDQRVNDLLKRFGYKAGLNNQTIKAAQEILKNSEEYDIRRTPKSIAAGIIYITCLLCGHKRTARDISYVADTSEGTIKKAYKELYPYLKLIVPEWFASETVVTKLHAP